MEAWRKAQILTERDTERERERERERWKTQRYKMNIIF